MILHLVLPITLRVSLQGLLFCYLFGHHLEHGGLNTLQPVTRAIPPICLPIRPCALALWLKRLPKASWASRQLLPIASFLAQNIPPSSILSLDQFVNGNFGCLTSVEIEKNNMASQMMMLNASPTEAERYSCPSCSKSFVRKAHMLRHQQQRP